MSFWGFHYSPKWEYSFLIPTPKLFITHESFENRVLSKKRIGPHNYNILCLIFGSLLGDSYAETRNNSTRIHFQQEDSNVNYLHYTWKLVNKAGYCSDEKPELKPRIGKNNKTRFTCRFKTFSYTSFNWIKNEFYVDNKKIVPATISDYLSPLALAIWIINDGTWTKEDVRIATNSFSKKDNLFLCEILKNKYNLTSITVINGYSVNGDPQYNVYIQANSIPTLRNIVKPYFVDTILYKLGL
jgi:ubiquinol-cytochrome c reductase cytochrome b subunit